MTTTACESFEIADDGEEIGEFEQRQAMTVEDIHRFARSSGANICIHGEPLESTVRKRLIHARRLNKLEQIEAAPLLGYSNSSPISKIENGPTKIPKDFIVKAAIAYGVSTDYLLGLSNEPERDPKTAEHMAIMRAVEMRIASQSRALATVLLKNAADMPAMEGHLSAVLSATKDCIETFNKIRRDKVFVNDVRGGAGLMRAIDNIQESAMKARDFLDRRSALIDTRTEAQCEGKNYPLFDGADLAATSRNS